MALLKETLQRTERLPVAVVSEGEWAFEGAYKKVLYHKHRCRVRLVHGVPIPAGGTGWSTMTTRRSRWWTS